MLKVCIVQRGAWEMPLESMPLAAGYLKAALDREPDIAPHVQTEICNFGGGDDAVEMSRRLFTEPLPDVLAFSVLGWNYRSFGCIADTYKQLNPRGVVVYGGNHVAYQAERVFREHASVDVVVNGEGELVFVDLVRYILGGSSEWGPKEIDGISYQTTDGTVLTTPDRDRIDNLDSIASPFLNDSIPLVGPTGKFPYDVALMETNRGCPYKCSFCYWGGAVGQRMRCFSPERLAAELDVFGYYQVPTVVLCDSNFGLLESDESFIESLIRTREKHGFPRALETSWAKNKSNRFYRIVKNLQKHGFASSFTLALQTLTADALLGMRRNNMKVNQWEDLVSWLTAEGLDCYVELIWGAPGDTTASFLKGYDHLAKKVSRIAVYPMLLLPNTSYFESRDVHGFVTVRGADDDFDYVLANRTSTVAENFEMQRFIFWARLLGENQYFRYLWRPTRDLVGLQQSDIVRSLMQWFDQRGEEPIVGFCRQIPAIAESAAVVRSLRQLFAEPELGDEVRAWWRTRIVPRFPDAWQEFAIDLFDYEAWARPLYVAPGAGLPTGWSDTGETGGRYVSPVVDFAHPVAAMIADWSDVPRSAPRRSVTSYVFEAPIGFYDHIDNHETATHYAARARPVVPARQSAAAR